MCHRHSPVAGVAISRPDEVEQGVLPLRYVKGHEDVHSEPTVTNAVWPGDENLDGAKMEKLPLRGEVFSAVYEISIWHWGCLPYLVGIASRVADEQNLERFC